MNVRSSPRGKVTSHFCKAAGEKGRENRLGGHRVRTNQTQRAPEMTCRGKGWRDKGKSNQEGRGRPDVAGRNRVETLPANSPPTWKMGRDHCTMRVRGPEQEKMAARWSKSRVLWRFFGPQRAKQGDREKASRKTRWSEGWALEWLLKRTGCTTTKRDFLTITGPKNPALSFSGANPTSARSAGASSPHRRMTSASKRGPCASSTGHIDPASIMHPPIGRPRARRSPRAPRLRACRPVGARQRAASPSRDSMGAPIAPR